MGDLYDIDGHSFGRHMRSLRKARGLTQAALAQQAGLSADTIRRLENGAFSPSLATLVRMSRGLDLRLSTLMVSFELGILPAEQELADMLVGRDESQVRLAIGLLAVLFEGLEREEEG